MSKQSNARSRRFRGLYLLILMIPFASTVHFNGADKLDIQRESQQKVAKVATELVPMGYQLRKKLGHDHLHAPVLTQNNWPYLFTDPEYSCADISDGMFDERWEGYIGNIDATNGIVLGPEEGIVSGRHTIISESVMDINTCEEVPSIFPGSDYSIKLGNEKVGARAEALRYRMTVDPNNSLFIYRYAVIMQDPNHKPEEQPRFELKILDSNNNIVDRNCGFYRVVATQGLDGFGECPIRGTVYRDWVTVGIDFSDYADQDIILEFTTGDCTQGGHYGYAYFEPLQCRPFGLEVADFCPNTSNELSLLAPLGFSYQWNTGQTTRQITVVDPQPGDYFSCTLTSLVNAQCKITLDYTIPAITGENIVFTATPDACGDTYSFDASETVLPANGNIEEFIWDFGDGTVLSSGTDPTITHMYSGVGDFEVLLTVKSGSCEFTETAEIAIHSIAPGAIASAQTICAGTSVSLTEEEPAVSDYPITYKWQQSPDGDTFEDIPNAIGTDYDTPPLDSSMRFRRVDIFDVGGGVFCERYTNEVLIAVNRFLVEGTIARDRTFCLGEETISLTEEVAPQTIGDLTYQWYQSDDGVEFEPIEGADQKDYNATSLERTTWFKRVDSSTLNDQVCTSETNVVQLQMNTVNPGSIEAVEVICFDADAGIINEIAPASGEGDLSYQWQISADGMEFEDITEAKTATFEPGALIADTWFRRVDTSTLEGLSCSALTEPVLIRVVSPLVVPTPLLDVGSCQNTENGEYGTLVSIAEDAIAGGTGVYPMVRFLWDNGTPNDVSDDVLLQEGSSFEYVETSLDARTILVEVQDDLGCTGRTSVDLPEIEPLIVTFDVKPEFCLGDADGTIELFISGGHAPYSSRLVGEDNDFVMDQTAFYGLVGGRSYTIEVMDAKGCQEEVVATLQAAVDLSTTIEVDYYCEPGGSVPMNTVNVTLLDTSLVDEVLYMLDGDESTTQLEPVFENLSPGIHEVTVSHSGGCIWRGVEFEVLDIPPLELAADTSKINQVSLMGWGGTAPYEYSFAGGAYGTDNVFAFFETGQYTLMVRDALGCEASLLVDLEFFPIKVPRYFTPNGDGFQDGWRPSNLEQYPKAQTFVYDRYGRVVARLEVNESWDGIYEGAPLPTGDYWYVIYDVREGPDYDPIMGHFTLFR